MKKIPLRSADNPAPELPPAPTAVPEALETLLLGGIWWFVLILLPMLQQLPQDRMDEQFHWLKVQGLATASIALVLLILRLLGYKQKASRQSQELIVLAGILLLGGGLVWQSMQVVMAADYSLYIAGLQGIFALGYFLSRRRSAGSV